MRSAGGGTRLRSDSAAGERSAWGETQAAFLLTWGPKILALCLLMLSYTKSWSQVLSIRLSISGF